MHRLSDEDLIRKIGFGDRLAIDVLYRRHHIRLYRFVLRLTNNEAVAEDIVSDVFFHVWQNADRFEGRSTVSTWMFAIARFKVLSLRRQHQHQELGSEEDLIEDPADDPESLVQKLDKREMIGLCLKSLSVAHREVIDLVYYHEKSIEEVGEILCIPVNTVKSRMFNARKRLSELLLSAGMDRGWP